VNDATRSPVRMVTTALAAAASLVAVFAMTGQPVTPAANGVAIADVADPAPAGWRWEWYGTVEVQVPDDWGYSGTNAPPCLVTGKARHGTVGRPGVIPTIACLDPVPPLDKRADHMWFDTRGGAGVTAYDGGWVAETRVVAGIAIEVFSDDAVLRSRILDSARPATGGCPAEHAVVTDPGYRPDPGPGGLAAMGPVESITLCRYAFGEAAKPSAGVVLSKSRLSGKDARAVARAIQVAPEGDGPNQPQTCIPEVALGNEVLLLQVRDDVRGQEVVVHYSGCDGHAVDDGHTRHRLTSDVLRPLLSGSHHPDVLAGGVAALVWP